MPLLVRNLVCVVAIALSPGCLEESDEFDGDTETESDSETSTSTSTTTASTSSTTTSSESSSGGETESSSSTETGDSSTTATGGTCVDGETGECVSAFSIWVCVDGEWQAEYCMIYCMQQGCGGSEGCDVDPETRMDACQCLVC